MGDIGARRCQAGQKACLKYRLNLTEGVLVVTFTICIMRSQYQLGICRICLLGLLEIAAAYVTMDGGWGRQELERWELSRFRMSHPVTDGDPVFLLAKVRRRQMQMFE